MTSMPGHYVDAIRVGQAVGLLAGEGPTSDNKEITDPMFFKDDYDLSHGYLWFYQEKYSWFYPTDGFPSNVLVPPGIQPWHERMPKLQHCFGESMRKIISGGPQG